MNVYKVLKHDCIIICICIFMYMCICVDTYIYLHLYILFIYYQSGTSLWGVTCSGQGPRCEGLISHGLVVRGKLVRASL
jgi:hypothetical protein